MQRGDGLDGVSAADGLGAGFGHPKVLYLALGDEVLDRAGDLLDGNVGVDAVLVEEIDDIDAEALERAFDGPANLLRAAVRRMQPWSGIAGPRLKPNLVAITTLPLNGARASPTSSSLMKGP